MSLVTPTRMLMEAERMLHRNLGEVREMRQVAQTVANATAEATAAVQAHQDTLSAVNDWIKVVDAAADGANNALSGTNNPGDAIQLSKLFVLPDADAELKLLGQVERSAERLAEAAGGEIKKLLKG